MLRHLLVLLGIVMLSAFVGSTLPAASARSTASPSTTIITAGRCSASRQGQNLSLRLANHVTLTRVQDDQSMTLKCQQLQASSVQNGLQEAEATRPIFTWVQTVAGQNGQAVKYRIEIFGATSTMKNNIVTVLGEAGADPARLVLVQLDKPGTSKANLVARKIIYNIDTANSGKAGTFFSALGDASLTASLTPPGTNGQDGRAYRLLAQAEKIGGQFEAVPGKAGMTRVFRLERDGGRKPHLDVTSLVPGDPDRLRMDADSLLLYPDYFAFRQLAATGADQATVPMITATGAVEFTGAQRQRKADRSAAGNEVWETVGLNGHSQEFKFQWATSQRAGQRFDRYISLHAGKEPAQLVMTRENQEPVPINIAALFLYDLDTAGWGTFRSDADAQKFMRGEDL